MMTFTFDAYVTHALFDSTGQAIFALGDGTVRFGDGTVVDAHPNGAVLCACGHPSGEGIVTGGDDGRVVWTRAAGAQVIGEIPKDHQGGRWIDAVAASPASGFIAFAAGKDLQVRDVADAGFARAFRQEASVAAIAFEPKGGKRLATATYGGVALWYARVAEQKPQMLKWAGSHVGLVWSPDGRFIVSSMQEGQLHGWRLSDAKTMQMGGYPAKVKAMTFLYGGLIMATSGAHGAVVWPFGGANGPMGKQASEVAYDPARMTTRVAALPALSLLAVGRDDGRVSVLNLQHSRVETVRVQTGAPISALALSPDAGRLAWGDEDGNAGVAELPAL
jgi:WD40 repeat protein